MARSGKTRKSITKRFKFTKSGKILRLKTGKDHLLAKKTSRQKGRKKGFICVDKTLVKVIRKNLFY
ncbi:MAG: 50S ribosomal protein L35 [bacterium]|nr:50S ribosomal protein L35 [bacterium]